MWFTRLLLMPILRNHGSPNGAFGDDKQNLRVHQYWHNQLEKCTLKGYILTMVFIETTFYTRSIADYLSDEEQGELQAYLIEHPDDGDIIKGTGGIRKIRWGSKGKGKRGGVRVVYYWRTAKDHIYLLSIYGKNEVSDLTPKEKEQLKKLVEVWNR
jgi:mRNA-degrading endonuclease RelE of RelBE toxin-antitoxin system